jgi:hypothetical protein
MVAKERLLLVGLSAAALGRRAVKNPLVAVFCVVAGVIVGHYTIPNGDYNLEVTCLC